MTKAEMLTAMMRVTGLSRAAIKDLMKHGWVYSENNGMASFTKETNDNSRNT